MSKKEFIISSILSRSNQNDVNQFFSQIDTVEGKNNILDFLKDNFDTFFGENVSINQYDALGSTLVMLPLKHLQYGCEILKYFLDSAPSLKHKAECLVNIILGAGRYPIEFKPIESDLIELVDQFKKEIGQDLNDIYIFGSQDVQHYLEANLKHLPIHKTSPLINFYSGKASPIIEGILKKTYTDLEGENKIKLVDLLVNHLEELIKIPAFYYLFKNAEDARISLFEHSIGGGYITTSSGIHTITMGGSQDYIKNKSVSLITGLAHESMHFFIDKTFGFNDSKPHHKDDSDTENKWISYINYIMPFLKKVSPTQEELEEYTTISDNYNEFYLLTYREEDLIKELPAFLLQDQAIRKLTPNTSPSIINTLSIDILKYIQDLAQDHNNISLSGETVQEFMDL